MKLTKKQREVVYAMFGGRCAYCGCELPAKEWHADHKEPILRELEFARDKHGRTIMVATGKCCLERLLAESIAQRNEARKDVLVEKKRIEYVQDCLRECQSKLATARSQGREEGLREAAVRVNEIADGYLVKAHDAQIDQHPTQELFYQGVSEKLLLVEIDILALIPKK